MNMWIGVPLNFAALFFIGYVFSYNLRKSTVVPFGLLYLFMLYTPISRELVLERTLALLIGTLIIMMFQLIFNKNRFSKVGIKSTQGIYDNVILKIESMKTGNDTVELNKKIDGGIKAVKKIILDKRVKDFYLTESADILTQVIWTLERISISLDELKSESEKPDYQYFLDKLLVSLNKITVEEFEEHILFEKFKQSSIEDKFSLELDELLIDLKRDMENISQANNKKIKQDSDDIRIPYHFNKMLDFKRDFSISSLRFSFAIILLSGYLNPFFSNYRDAAVTFTISAVASAALMGGTIKFVIARISFVLLGTVIALVANRFILPFKIEDGKKAIMNIYDHLARQMLRDVKNIEQDHNNNMKSLFLVPSLIEDRMHLLNFGVNCEEESEFITNRRVLINNIYKHYTSLKKESGKKEDIYEMISELEKSLDQESKERRN